MGKKKGRREGRSSRGRRGGRGGEEGEEGKEQEAEEGERGRETGRGRGQEEEKTAVKKSRVHLPA